MCLWFRADRGGPRDTDAAALADVLTPGAPALRPAPGHGDDVDNVTTLLAERELTLHRLAAEVVDACPPGKWGRSVSPRYPPSTGWAIRS